MVEVAPRVFVGAKAAAHGPTLAALGVDTVVNVGGGRRPADLGEGVAYWQPARALRDSADAAGGAGERVLRPAAQFVADALAGGSSGVLVHCRGGCSRSPAVVAAYLVLALGLTPEEALEALRAARPAARPNAGLVEELSRLVSGRGASGGDPGPSGDGPVAGAGGPVAGAGVRAV